MNLLSCAPLSITPSIQFPWLTWLFVTSIHRKEKENHHTQLQCALRDHSLSSVLISGTMMKCCTCEPLKAETVSYCIYSSILMLLYIILFLAYTTMCLYFSCVLQIIKQEHMSFLATVWALLGLENRWYIGKQVKDS